MLWLLSPMVNEWFTSLSVFILYTGQCSWKTTMADASNQEHPVTDFSLMTQIRKQLHRLFSRWSLNVPNSCHVNNTSHGFYGNFQFIYLQYFYTLQEQNYSQSSTAILISNICGYLPPRNQEVHSRVTWPTNHVITMHYTQNPKNLKHHSPTVFCEFLTVLECFSTWYIT